jgi:hypothetical protein
MKRKALLQGEIIAKSKGTLKFIKIFSRTHGSNSVKLYTKYL